MPQQNKLSTESRSQFFLYQLFTHLLSQELAPFLQRRQFRVFSKSHPNSNYFPEPESWLDVTDELVRKKSQSPEPDSGHDDTDELRKKGRHQVLVQLYPRERRNPDLNSIRAEWEYIWSPEEKRPRDQNDNRAQRSRFDASDRIVPSEMINASSLKPFLGGNDAIEGSSLVISSGFVFGMLCLIQSRSKKYTALRKLAASCLASNKCKVVERFLKSTKQYKTIQRSTSSLWTVQSRECARDLSAAVADVGDRFGSLFSSNIEPKDIRVFFEPLFQTFFFKLGDDSEYLESFDMKLLVTFGPKIGAGFLKPDFSRQDWGYRSSKHDVARTIHSKHLPKDHRLYGRPFREANTREILDDAGFHTFALSLGERFMKGLQLKDFVDTKTDVTQRWSGPMRRFNHFATTIFGIKRARAK